MSNDTERKRHPPVKPSVPKTAAIALNAEHGISGLLLATHRFQFQTWGISVSSDNGESDAGWVVGLGDGKGDER